MMTETSVSLSSQDVHVVDEEAEHAKPRGGKGKEPQDYEQHSDPDVIIPDKIARALVMSAQLLLINGILAIAYSLYILGALLLLVWITSIVHWTRPRFSSMRRIIDYVAVMATIGYGTWLSTTLLMTYMVTWLVGLSAVGMIFALNETAYYLQIGKTPLGTEEESRRGAFLQYTPPNTPEREWIYRRTAYIHLLCVHVLANALTLAIIIGSKS